MKILLVVCLIATLFLFDFSASSTSEQYSLYGFNKLHYEYDFDKLTPDYCVTEEDGGKANFCDGAQFTVTAIKNAQNYIDFAQAVINNPPPQIQDMVQNEFTNHFYEDMTQLSRITKEQIRVKEFKEEVNIVNLQLESKFNNYFINRNQLEPFILEAPKKTNCDEPDWLRIPAEMARANSVQQRENLAFKTAEEVLLECYQISANELNTGQDLVLLLKDPLFDFGSILSQKNIPGEPPVFFNLKEANLVSSDSEFIYLISFKTFFDGLDEIFNDVKNNPGSNNNLTFMDVFDNHLEPRLSVRNHQLISSSLLDHVKKNATVWPDEGLRSSLSGFDFDEPFPFVEVPKRIYLIHDNLSQDFFLDFSQTYGQDLSGFFGKVVGFPLYNTPAPGQLESFDESGLVESVFFSAVNISNGLIRFDDPEINLNLKESLEELDVKQGTLYNRNPFLKYAIDGQVGLVAGQLDRQGYGTDFDFTSPEAEDSCPFQTGESWIPSNSNSNALSKILISKNDSTDNGSLALSVSEIDDNVWQLTCFPNSNPNLNFSLVTLIDQLKQGNIQVTEEENGLNFRWLEQTNSVSKEISHKKTVFVSSHQEGN